MEIIMFAWWDSLSLVSQIFACVAIPATVVLLVQTVLMLVGIGLEADGGDISVGESIDADGPEFDVDLDGMDALRIFSIRGIIAFLVVFGWVGFVMDRAGIMLLITIPVAAVCGFLMMLVLALLMRTVMRLRNDGNLDNRNALGVSGRVYLTVPPARTGEGKVNVLLQGTYVERDAVTDEGEPIPTGCEIVVIGLSGQTTLVVKRK
ncbi:MAG: hypothetical protein E7601_07040 [Ruminococcaceae bacterium]|nr:hypothetical protein [Oscillospiraceae bacterium]